MKEYNLPKRTLLLWQIRAAAIFLLLAIVCGFYSFRIKPLIIALIVLAVVFLILCFWYLPNFFRRCKIKYLKGAVVVEKGVIIKNCYILPFSRLIYTQSLKTPLAKAFGVTALTLKAARSKIFIPEMKNSDAEEFLILLSKGETI